MTGETSPAAKSFRQERHDVALVRIRARAQAAGVTGIGQVPVLDRPAPGDALRTGAKANREHGSGGRFRVYP